MSGPDDSGNEGGFLGPTGSSIVHGILDFIGQGGSALDKADKVNQASGAVSAASGLLQRGESFGDIIKHPLELWKMGGQAADSGMGVLGGLPKLFGPAGQVMGALQAGADGTLFANDVYKEGAARAYHDQTAYNHLGGAAIGAANAVLPMLGPYGQAANAALGVATSAADTGGKLAGKLFGKQAEFSSDQVAGGLIRGMWGDQSLGDQARRGVTNLVGHNAVGNTLGGVADVVTNTVAAPVNFATTAARGVVHEGEAIAAGAGNAVHTVSNAVDKVMSW